jgi:hypothetical protein
MHPLRYSTQRMSVILHRLFCPLSALRIAHMGGVDMRDRRWGGCNMRRHRSSPVAREKTRRSWLSVERRDATEGRGAALRRGWWGPSRLQNANKTRFDASAV